MHSLETQARMSTPNKHEGYDVEGKTVQNSETSKRRNML
jgi:hypothetical protein